MMDIIQLGGWIMWPLFGISLIAAILFLDRFISLHRAQIKTYDFLKGIFNVLERRNIVEAVTICDETPGPVSHIVRAAVLCHDEPPARIRHAIEQTGLIEIPRMEKHLGLLATLAKIAPAMGLLGTVLGLIRFLRAAQTQAPLVQSGDVLAGLWQALICTAAGLLISILVYTGYNFLVGRIESIVLDMEKAAGEIFFFLTKERKP